MQLYGYGIVLSKIYKKEFKKAIISYSNNLKIFKINITPKIKEDFLNTINNIDTSGTIH